MFIDSIPENLPKGDMPGDVITITSDHLRKANSVLSSLMPLLSNERTVISVYGGSGSGKSETASLIAYALNKHGINSYIMSGDNYPRRIPKYNDAERLRIFRLGGIKRLLSHEMYTKERSGILAELQKTGLDAETEQAKIYPWLEEYQAGGDTGLRSYLGTLQEIDFSEVCGIISHFKSGAKSIFLKRMGRNETELWYDLINFEKTQILILEWTHGNNDNLQGLIDIPIYLQGTPSETLAHRMSRGRDKGADSSFVARILNIEAERLASQVQTAKMSIDS